MGITVIINIITIEFMPVTFTPSSILATMMLRVTVAIDRAIERMSLSGMVK